MALSRRLPGPFLVFSALLRKRITLGQGLPESSGFEGLGRPGSNVCCCASLAGDHVSEGPNEGGVQELLWQKFFLDPTQWWDNRRTPLHPHFRHKESKEALWLDYLCKPAWVESQLAMWDAAGRRRPPESTRSTAPYEGDLQVGTCRKLCEEGQVTEAVDELTLLVQQGCHIPESLFYHVLKKCVAKKDLVLGSRIHDLTVESGYAGNAFLATYLIGLYASRGRLEEAMGVFSKVTLPSSYNWASIIFAYARHGDPMKAVELYRQMRESTFKPDNRIFVAVLKACASARDLAAGKDVHAHILGSAGKPDIFVQNSLVHMYAKCGSLNDARRLFDKLCQKNVVTWTAIIAGYVQHGMGQEALNLYACMQQEGITPPDSVAFACLLQACASVAALQQGKQLHSQIEERGLQADVVVGNSLVNMYAKCRSLEDAQRVFDRLSQKDVVTWTVMIAGYAQEGMGQEALNIYKSMQQEGISPPDPVTFICLLQACAGVGIAALDQGRQLHAQIEELGVKADVVVGSSLVNMYAKCGGLDDAQRIFDRLSIKNVVTWNAMLAGYAQQGMGHEALNLYSIMQQYGVTSPDAVTFVCLLHACASVASLPIAKQLHSQIGERGLEADVAVGASLVNTYAKCGSLEDAQQVFDSLPERDSVAWGALIGGYARQGDSDAVFDLVERMSQEGIQPNSITFLSVLTVCSHVGLLEKGRKYFEAMNTDYSISPTIEHYTCMVGLLGRAGHLNEALQMVKTMPFQPSAAVWITLLGACQKWSNVEVGRQAFDAAVRMDEKDAAAYVLMANTYIGAQMWEEAREMQARRLKSGAWKQQGQSWWTDACGVVHAFVVGDNKHSESEGIYSRLDQLLLRMKKDVLGPCET